MSETINIQQVIDVIDKSDLDSTIKEILIRDLKNEGLTEFLREQIIAYCDKAISLLDKRIEEEAGNTENPTN
jgi:hypothetical protein